MEERASAAAASSALTAEEEALLTEAMTPRFNIDAPSSSTQTDPVPLDLDALMQEDEEIRRRTALAMASLNAERSEMRELLTNAGGSSAANDAEDYADEPPWQIVNDT